MISDRDCEIVAFQSTPSVWRATEGLRKKCDFFKISIHALRVEGDLRRVTPITSVNYFNPRPPCGGRPSSTVDITIYLAFQSTPSVWRAT